MWASGQPGVPPGPPGHSGAASTHWHPGLWSEVPWGPLAGSGHEMLDCEMGQGGWKAEKEEEWEPGAHTPRTVHRGDHGPGPLAGPTLLNCPKDHMYPATAAPPVFPWSTLGTGQSQEVMEHPEPGL